MNRKLLLAVLIVFFSSYLYSLEAPTITEPADDSWDSGRVYVRWTPVSGATGYAFSFGKEATADLSAVACEDATSTGYAASDGIYYFIIASCTGSERSPANDLKFNIDNTQPSGVEGLKVEPTEDGKMKLTWNAATDNLSGIASYTLYRNRLFKFAIDDLSTKKYTAEVTEYIDGNVEERGYYNYKILATDRAGNRGLVTLISKGARIIGSCDSNIALSMDYNSSSSSLDIKAESGAILYDINLSITEPNAEPSIVLNADGNSEISYSLALEGKNDGSYSARVEASDVEGDLCTAEKALSYDTAKPSIKFLTIKNNATIDAEAKLSFEVDDGLSSSGIKSAKLSLLQDSNSFDLSPLSNEGKNYSYDFNASKYRSGYYSLKAEAEDNSGNKAEISINFLLNNKATETEKVTLKIGEAEKSLSGLAAALLYSAKLGIPSEAAKAKIADAESSLSSARALLSEKKYSSALKAAESAISSLNSAKGMLSITIYKEDMFSFSRAKLKQLLKEAGLSEDSVKEADVYFSRHSPKRKLTILSVKDNDQNYFSAFVGIEADAIDSNDLFFYEIIPKEAITYLGEPVVSGTLKKLSGSPIILGSSMESSGHKFSFSYAFSAKLSKSEADSIISDRAIQKFSLPPLVYDSNSVYLAKQYSSAIDFSLIIMAVFIIAAVAIIALAAFLAYRAFFSKHAKFREAKGKLGK